ncbi:MAG: peptide ABC transporter substrate-binding protein [Bdellovibrionaceae bacterium]|jgi:oligopeptide transport system substrate-binding protein|nr:peptide ABC transporter substrate-binding protein [Pseudobdellovibrionaceae bacterium]
MLKVLITFLLALSFLACTKKDKQSGSNEYGLKNSETLRIVVDREPPSLDWSIATDTESALITNNLMEGLVAYNLKDPELSLQPALALKWTSSENAKKWTFKLRRGVKWSDGVEFTAQQIVDSWVRLLSPLTASEYAYFLFGIKNAKEFNKGTIKDSKQLGIKVSPQGDIQVELESSMSYFPYLLTHSSTFPIRLDLIKKHGVNKWTEAGNHVGLGPFNLKVWEHDKVIILERNERYYGEKAKVKNVLGYIVGEKSTALNLFDNGQVDAVKDLPKSELRFLAKKKEFIKESMLGIFYLGFNVKKAPFDNVLVRKAFIHAIDRNEIVKVLGAGEVPLKGWVPQGMFGHNNNVGLAFDVAKAKKYLNEAGFTDLTKFPKIEIGFNTNENHQRVIENVQAQLKRNLGISVDLKNEEWKVYLNTLKSNAPHMFRMGWVADYPDPDNFLNLMTSYSDNNHTGWGDTQYDHYIEEAVSVADKSVRKLIYQKAQKILLEKGASVFPTYSMVQTHMVSQRVKNFPVNAVYQFLFKDVELEKAK